jgi:selenoprotein W-related protein
LRGVSAGRPNGGDWPAVLPGGRGGDYHPTNALRSPVVPARPVKIQIHYCAECGYDHEALDLTAALMKEFHMYLGGITIVPSGDGAYDVRVDGDLVHSMYRDGGFGDREQILAAVRAKLG